MSDEDINFSFKDIKAGFGKAAEFFRKKKVLTAVLGIILAGFLAIAILIRLENLPLLIDHATGKYIPLALDPFYFLREAQTILHLGSLPPLDPLRYVPLPTTWSKEILSYVVIGIYKIGLLFNPSMTLGFADVIYPVIFFALGWIAFFFFILTLTKSKMTAMLSSIFLAIIPSYLSMTVAGFARHEALGMFAFYITLMCFTLVLRYLNREEGGKKPILKSVLFGIGLGFLSAFAFASWGGISVFICAMIPTVFLLFWLVKFQHSKDTERQKEMFIFYSVFMVSEVLFGAMYGFNISGIIQEFWIRSTSIISMFAWLFFVVDMILGKVKDKIKFIKKENLENHRTVYGLIASAILGVILLTFHGGGPITFFGSLIHQLLYPFGTARVGLTVAEFAQPYLTNWINDTGNIFFWIMAAGLAVIGINLSKGIKYKRARWGFIFFWILLISGILFSRVSPNSMFNGTNFISQLFYFGSMAAFGIYLIVVYVKREVDFKPEMLFIMIWTILMLISSRSAVRVMFIIAPFACFAAGYLLFNLGSYVRKIKKKDDLLKLFVVLLLLGAIIASIFSFNNLINSSVTQAKYSGTSANNQWQYSMAWVQNNTAPGSVFASWWDYGYWIQTLGGRPTVLDGANRFSFWDYLMGRYVLTTPNPDTALSFLKTHNVSYYLIDPTDLGKYPAYSSIGSGSGATANDRYSSVPIMPASSSQTQTVGNTTIMAYQNIVPTDQDIIYNSTQGQIFIPQGKAYTVGVVMNTTAANNGSSTKFGQPQMVLYYNNQQFRLPLKYAYYNGKLIDFGNGYPGGVYILPTLSQSSTTYSINPFGSVVYMSPKVFSSFFAQMYLMNDAMNEYPTLMLAHAQYDPLMQALRAQGFKGEFIYYNGQFDGPIKIWKVNYPSDIKTFSGFLDTSGTYGGFDNATFTK